MRAMERRKKLISVGYRVNSVRATQFRQWATQVLREFAIKGYVKIQNKLHFAIYGHTAAELIMQRADSSKDHVGLTSWEKTPNGKIRKTDVPIAKNYLTKEELDSLGRIVNAYLEPAKFRCCCRIIKTQFLTGPSVCAKQFVNFFFERGFPNKKNYPCKTIS